MIDQIQPSTVAIIPVELLGRRYKSPPWCRQHHAPDPRFYDGLRTQNCSIAREEVGPVKRRQQ